MRKIYLRFLFSVMVLAGFSSCSTTSRLASPQNTGDTREAVMQADREFSKMSEQKGLNTAFIAYSANNGVLLRPQSQPIIGRDNVRMYLTRNSDSGIRFTRSPQYAEIAASGDLAYTYGTYLVESQGMDGKVITSEGNYVTIWQKDEKGFWKFVVDTGNSGLKP